MDSVGLHENVREIALVVSKDRRRFVQDDLGMNWRQGEILHAPVVTSSVKMDLSSAN